MPSPVDSADFANPVRYAMVELFTSIAATQFNVFIRRGGFREVQDEVIYYLTCLYKKVALMYLFCTWAFMLCYINVISAAVNVQ